MQKKFILLALIFSTTIIFGQKTKSIKNNHQTVYIIENVNVITMASSNSIIKNATFVISNNLIQSINGAIPKNATVIDGKGKWLIPGLIDAHVHLPVDGV